MEEMRKEYHYKLSQLRLRRFSGWTKAAFEASLKWGEALVYAGKRDEAKDQFARAAQLDLTAAEKSELQKYSANRICTRRSP